jgi:hypothetical protein
MMAGKADHSSTGQTGPMARRSAAGRPQPPNGQPERVSVPIEAEAVQEPLVPQTTASPTLISPDVLPRLLQTQASYRLLVSSGFTGQDAAALISYVVGLPRCDSRWSLAQVNRMLFLRALYSDSKWGEAERRPA